MPELSERVDKLEEIIVQTQLMLQSLAYEVSRTQLTVNNLSHEMKEFKNEIRQDRKEMNKKWGDLSNKWGTILEDMVIPNIKFIAERYFNFIEPYRFIQRIETINIKSEKKREFDAILICGNKIILNETKASPKQDYMEKFIALIINKDFYDYFPEYKDYELIPIFSTLYFKEENIKFLTKNKIYAMAMNEDNMDLINFEDIKFNK